jgi:hypothetical protein
MVILQRGWERPARFGRNIIQNLIGDDRLADGCPSDRQMPIPKDWRKDIGVKPDDRNNNRPSFLKHWVCTAAALSVTRKSRFHENALLAIQGCRRAVE